MSSLTIREKKLIIHKIMESYQGITLSEVKNNNNIKSEIKLNFQFYNEVKKGFLNERKNNLLEIEGIFGSILGTLGSIKDFLTGNKIIKNIAEWIKNLLEKIKNKLNPLAEKYAVLYVAKRMGEDLINVVSSFTKWLYEVLSYKGLSKLFAMIKYRTFKPSEEQIKCMELAAKKVWKWLLITLVAAFLIKIMVAAITAKTAAAITINAFQASLSPILAVLGKFGLKAWGTKIFSTYSAALKAKDASKIENEIKTQEKEFKEGEMDSFKEAWNYCSTQKLPQSPEST